LNPHRDNAMELNDLLRQQDIDPVKVLVLRHRPWESELRKVLPWIANERSDLFNAYQATQNPRVEKSMSRSKFVASFLGQEPGKALFVGLYEQCGSRSLTRKEFWEISEYIELGEYGMGGFSDSDERHTIRGISLRKRQSDGTMAELRSDRAWWKQAIAKAAG